jgi:two-component system, NtrC family, response regulator AtoC
VAATHRDLRQLVSAGQFREDLFHRLDLYRIQIPPLRERGEDIAPLAELLVQRLCQRHRLPVRRMTEPGRRKLRAYPWPGNVRELAHELERAIVFEDSEELSFDHLVAPLEASEPPGALADWFNPQFTFPSQGFALEEAIGFLIRRALQQSGGNVSAAARLLGVTRDYLRYHVGAHKTG